MKMIIICSEAKIGSGTKLMHKLTRLFGLLLLSAFLLLPSTASAYSYGDANSDEVAETFKLVIASVEAPTPDWDKALAAHNERKAEISSHFGEEVAKTLSANIQAHDKDLTVTNYKALLVMNLDRRFQYALKDVNDYTNAKLLLAKAKATYVVLQPYVQEQITDADKLKSLDQAFDAALEALGNPGLFGAGKKESKPEEFKKNVLYVYDTVKPLFPYKPEAGAKDGGKGTANETINPDAQHAPMEHTNKTNPLLTFGLIGGVIVIGALSVWFAKKKGLF